MLTVIPFITDEKGQRWRAMRSDWHISEDMIIFNIAGEPVIVAGDDGMPAFLIFQTEKSWSYKYVTPSVLPLPNIPQGGYVSVDAVSKKPIKGLAFVVAASLAEKYLGREDVFFTVKDYKTPNGTLWNRGLYQYKKDLICK